MNGIDLLKIIRAMCYSFKDQKCLPQSIYEANNRFCSMRQSKHETPVQCCERHQNCAQVLEQCGGTIGQEEELLKVVYKEKKIKISSASASEKDDVSAASRERILGIGFIAGADTVRCGTMLRSFENACTAGRDEWPKTLSDAHRVMTNWKQERNSSPRLDNEGVSFATEGGGEGKKKNAHATCFKCGKKGHVSYECPGTDEETDTNANTQEGNHGSNGELQSGEQLLIDAVEDAITLKQTAVSRMTELRLD